MAARYSDAQLREAGDLAARADELRHRVTDLVDTDARAYQAALAACRLPKDGGQRQRQVREALLGATLVPLEMAGRPGVAAARDAAEAAVTAG